MYIRTGLFFKEKLLVISYTSDCVMDTTCIQISAPQIENLERLARSLYPSSSVSSSFMLFAVLVVRALYI